jgi:hypothetical protein
MRRPFDRLPDSLVLLSVAVALGSPAGRTAAQQPNAAPLVYQSIEGSIETIDQRLNGIILRGSDGKRHAWKLQAPVIQEAARYKPGDSMWVIYRQIGASERAVTALGFPGTHEKPLYVNATGESVLLTTGPYTDNVCRPVAPERMTDQQLRAGSEFADEAPCWCCATRGKQCELANRSHDERGTGRIVLARCFP